MAYYNILSSSDDDEDIIRPKRFKQRMNYFDDLDDIEFKMRFRLNKNSVLLILNHIEEVLIFRSNRNNPISPMQQLLLTLRFYATGSFIISAGDFAGVSTTSAHRIIHRVTNAIARLRARFMKFPTTNNEIKKQQLEFYKISRFPRVVGCIDCTHVRVQSFGTENAELFRNRKGYFSLNVQVVTNSNLEITDVVARWPGSTHDSTIFNNSQLRGTFEQGIHRDGLLLGDSGYPIKSYLMTPLLNPRTPAEQLYNESHIRTRNIIERLFGIWKRRFPVLALGLRLQLNSVMAVIVATAVLHNVARQNGDEEPPEDPNLNLPAPWDEIFNYGNINPDNADYRNNDNAADRRILINDYFQSLL
ncbi:PREDICTED: putative nuclease HARBI1 isoform X2 [Trachymyrmex cornetzi]|uniref:putative nuclease HARBI1 isoform X2 n=1 Tax=Trachymyrmex cornetzi TaxID=471704 RepID=UPI00084EEB00|nr:PREDICTED: putative nuclease HARBI1 isoform X2 [Trachymyrmex cornetzi]XP_018367207.1 PREDICTED: putative nuclease HARBI1 isoform X2 [Trachymyrmex cornetzi]XP_018377274.1 PREDICTED: putative nuclease HARBI1 isoform X2 [Trachymyrmex cornetzi]